MKRLLPCFTLLLLGAAMLSPAWGQEKKNDQPERIEMLLSAAAEPSPPLRYSLAIGVRERTAGNAAQFYSRAIMFRRGLPEAHQKELNEKLTAWTEGPMTDQKAKEIKKWLEAYHSVFRELNTAVYRERCDWDLRLQDLKGLDAIAFLLPEVQDLRDIGRALRLKARVEVFEQKYDDAIETMRWGFQMGRDASRQQTLISSLVGIAIVSQMMDPLTELIRAPDSPNMYWAIATLPQPFIDIRESLEFERGFAEQIFPFLKNPETTDRSPQEWQRLLEIAFGEVSKLTPDGQAPDEGAQRMRQLGLALMLAKWYPAAKEALIESGMDDEKVESLPVAQAVAIHASRSLRQSYDNLYKTTLLPYEEGFLMMQRIESENARNRHRQSASFGNVVSSLLFSSTVSVKRAEMRVPRHFAVLQTIEAIRMHAAQTGHLPGSLRDITVVPVPLNPASHEPFPYLSTGDEAVLEMPIMLAEQPASIAKRFELRLRPTK